MDRTYPTLREVLQKIVGTQLSSVEFVEDYVQLEWKDSYLTAYTMPTLTKNGLDYRNEDADYKKTLCGLEGRVVNEADVNDESMSLVFSDGTLVSISLRDEDYVAPEALLYQERNGLLWVV